MKKYSLIAVLLLCAAAFAQTTDVPTPSRSFSRNTKPAPNAQRIHPSTRGGGLAPSTWGFVSHYSGSAYGTGYYPFRVDLTYAGSNSIYGYTFNYPSAGFTNEIRAIYAFDVSGLVGLAGPIWSSYMFDLRERPATGASSLMVLGAVNLEASGPAYSLTGLSLAAGSSVGNIDVYNAEDFENNDPFANPEAAFGGGETQLGTFAVTDGDIVPFDLNVTAEVLEDAGLGAEVPTLGTYGLIAMIGLLAGVGMFVVRRRTV